MKLQKTTNYAINILCYLHLKNNRLVTSAEMSRELGISCQYLMKVVNQLRYAKLVETVQGCRGGFKLVRSGESISIYEIVKIFEGEISLLKCSGNDPCGYRKADTKNCEVYKIFQSAQDRIIKQLENKYVSDFVNTGT